MKNILVLGATKGIGFGFVQELLRQPDTHKIYASYLHEESAGELQELEQSSGGKLHSFRLEITDELQLTKAVANISAQVTQLHLIINCVGILHHETLQPEKSLRQINVDNLLQYFRVNSVGGVLVAKHFLPLLRHSNRSVLATISAKVGSIGDNQLGGWYGYRASKAALNMLMRNVAIEYARSSPKTIVVLLHPGTTDTRLSRPFQKNVPPEKLFTRERSASQLLQVIAGLTESDSGKFFAWDGTVLPW